MRLNRRKACFWYFASFGSALLSRFSLLLICSSSVDAFLPISSSSMLIGQLELSLSSKIVRTLPQYAMALSSDSERNIVSSGKSKPVPIGKLIQQSVILDGPEWISVRNRLLLQRDLSFEQPSYGKTKVGILAVTSGSIDGERVVGMQVLVPLNQIDNITTVPLDQDDSIHLYKESIARIPDKVKEVDAVWTMIQSLSMIHCVRPVITNVGGSGKVEFLERGNVVVIGGNPLSIQAAKALHDGFNYNVTVVASDKPSGIPRGIRHLQPAIDQDVDDDDEDVASLLGFSAVLDKFDSLLDTLGNEQNDVDSMSSTSMVCKRLSEMHDCHVYISTVSESQRLVMQDGLLFGPKKSKEHIGLVTGRAPKTTAAFFPSPVLFGNTVETLLQKGLTLAPPSKPSSYHVRGWSLKDFWEYTTWPRDASSNTRFGFPGSDLGSDLFDDDDDYDDKRETMISAPPLRSVKPEMFETKAENFVDDVDPLILEAKSVSDLQRIVQDKTTCVLFVSAPFCRTCRYLKPQFQRLARQYPVQSTTNSTSKVADTSSNSTNLVFIKAEGSGQVGKDMGRALGIETVPTFILYKNGRRYGTPITSITRLPSKKLELAIDSMQNNIAWDKSLFQDEAESSNNRSKLT
jgi:thiol-disulfide isomerase/thioredoxin